MRHRMSGIALVCTAAVLAACAKANDNSAGATTPAAETASPAAPAPAPGISLADVAGKWNVRAVPETGDTTPSTYVLTATADSSGWSMKFPSGVTTQVHASVSGDSIVSWTGPFPSQRRKGVQVTTNSVFRRQGDKLVGETIAHYKVTTADSVLRLHNEGVRAQ